MWVSTKGSRGHNCSECSCEGATQVCALPKGGMCFLASRELGQGGRHCGSTRCCQGDELWVCSVSKRKEIQRGEGE